MPIDYSDYGRFTSKVIIAVLVLVVASFLLFLAASAAKILLIIFAGALLATFIRSMSVPLGRIAKLPHWSSTVLVILFFSGLLYLIGLYLFPQVAVQSQELGSRLPEGIQRLHEQIRNTDLGRMALSRLPNFEDLLKSERVLKEIESVFSVTFGVLSGLFIFLFIGLYLTFDPDVYIRGFIRLVPGSKKKRAAQVFEAIAITLRKWILGRLVSMAAVGIITGIGLRLFGVPLALTLGLLAGFLTFIPYIGAVISAVPAVLLALLQDPVLAFYVVGLYLFAHAVEAYVLTPIVQQHQVHLPPVFTLVVQILLGYAVGLLGLMMATPLAAMALVIVKMLYVEDVLAEKAHVPPGT